jgi:hypothetical protein
MYILCFNLYHLIALGIEITKILIMEHIKFTVRILQIFNFVI